MNDNDEAAAAAREILRDAFGRISDLVDSVCDGLTETVATYRPDADANTIGWLVWHLARIQDDHVAGLDGQEQVWTRGGWYDRFELPFDPDAHGYGQSPTDVAKVRTDAALLAGYHADVHRATVAYVDRLDTDELGRVVDAAWDPPVTVRVRLVSVMGDCLQHVGQAAYVKGVAQRVGVG